MAVEAGAFEDRADPGCRCIQLLVKSAP